jgi:hypothetical protein
LRQSLLCINNYWQDEFLQQEGQLKHNFISSGKGMSKLTYFDIGGEVKNRA